MYLTKLLTRVTAVLLLLAATIPCATAGIVYFDNQNKKWTTPHIHYWGGSSTSTYPGVAMTSKSGTIWEYTVPDNTTGILFNAGDGDPTKTSNFGFSDGNVYTETGDSGLTLAQYTGEEEIVYPSSYTIYFDNTKNWSTCKIYIWDDNDKNGDKVKEYAGAWSGTTLQKDANYPDLYSYTFTCTNTTNPKLNVIFNDGGDNKTVDLALVNNKVYKGDGTYVDISTYEPSNDPFTVYYDNYESTGWETVTCQYYVNDTWSNGPMTVDSGSIYKFDVPAGTTKVKFSYGNDATGELRATANMVYRHSGSTNTLRPNWTTPQTGDDNWPDEEYWISPSGVNQNQATTLYFNRKKGDGKLQNKEDIYVWIGLVTSNSTSDTDWKYAPTCEWNNIDSKYKMTKVDGDIYSLELKPTIAEWFGMSDTESATKLAFIFRDASGIKQDDNGTENGGNHYITLNQIPVDPSASNLGSFVSMTQEENKYTIVGTKGTLELTVWAPEIIKVFTYKKSAQKKTERKSISVVDKNDELLCYTVPTATSSVLNTAPETNNEGMLIITTKDDEGNIGLLVNIDKRSLLVTFSDREGNKLLAERTGIVNASNGGNTTASFEGNDNNEAFYGGGYSATLNRDGKSILMQNVQTGGWPDNDGRDYHNICIPYFVSTLGYGVLFDSHYLDDKITPSASGTSFSSASEDPVAYYFCGGGTMEKAMQNYNHLTGHQELPPYWALGYITSKYSFASDTEANNTVNNTKNINIPIDGIVYDIHWQGGRDGAYGMGALDWSKDGSYPSQGGIVKTMLKDKKVHSLAITEPYFNSVGPSSGNYSTLKNNGWLADERVNDNSSMSWIGGGANVGLIDVTNPDALNWFAQKYIDHTKKGMSGWWLDLGEPEGYDHDNGTKHQSGNHKQVRNEFGNVWIEGVYRALKTSTEKVDNGVDNNLHINEMRHILLPRAGTAGMQRFSCAPWTGDIKRSWSGLAVQVPSLLGASMAGVSYLGSDIGGFIADGQNADLYRRWIQLAVFYPMMRTHSANCPEVWQDVYSSVRDDVRNAINMRYQYLPYTYTQSFFYTRDGSPIARPANFADANKATNRNVTDAYLWGPDVYVAPMLSFGTSRSVSFPEGDWFDMDDYSKKYQGSRSTTIDVPTSKLPHFQRRGSFVTRYAQDTFTNTADINVENIIVDYVPEYGGGVHESYFFDDDHKSVNTVQDGKYVLTVFRGSAKEAGNGNTMTVAIDREGKGWDNMYTNQNIYLRIHDFKIQSTTSNGGELDPSEILMKHYGQRTESAPARAAESDAVFSKANSEADAKNSTSGNVYYHDTANNTMYVKLNSVNPTHGYMMQFANDGGFMTGIDSTVALETMTLSYGNGWFSYSAPEGTENLSIDVFTATGAQAAAYTNLNADGYVQQIPVDLGQGIYIARLTGRNSAGQTNTRTVKVIVK